jgi:tRNA(fMet)-specific endonuclease VapC
VTIATFMLDADSVSYAIRGVGEVGAHIVQHHPSEICLSALTVAQLRFGADRRRSKKLHRVIDSFTTIIAVVPFDESCATHFGVIASELAERGSPIGEFDTLIAAHAMGLNVTLVTNNEKHFRRVRGLKVVNWT